MRYLDVCAGISASSVAWKSLGWEAAAYSEIEPAPRAVLEHRQGALPVGWDHRHAAGSNITPLFGDFTQIEAHHVGPIDLLVGGTPCQDNSVGYSAGAGCAGPGLGGSRSGLAFKFARLAERADARWFVWENVPNVIAGKIAPDFLRLVRTFADVGFGLAWRILDSRGFGGLVDQPRKRLIVVGHRGDATRAGAVLFEPEGLGRDRQAHPEAAPVLTARGGMALDDRTPTILDRYGPRIATPSEWERSMGFPAGYTAVPHRGKTMADGPRYKVLGNSMDVRVMRWIGERIAAVDAMSLEQRDAA